jgi:hypothetical protein
MSDIEPLPSQSETDQFEIVYPSFYDLQDHANTGIVKRGIARYLIPKNYEKSIQRHQALGSPIVRRVVMGTVGRLTTSGRGGNYRLDHKRSPIEASANFAFRGTVFNEVIHTVGALPSSISLANNLVEGRGVTVSALSIFGISANLALVALQRYNRARMIQNVDHELQQGIVFRDDYKNYLGIDSRAVDNYIIDQLMQKNEATLSIEKDATYSTQRDIAGFVD